MPIWLTWLIEAVLKLWNGRGPSPTESMAKEAGAAETKVKDLEDDNATLVKADAASASLGPVLVDPDKLHEYTKTDPNNRGK